jgi:hypothetical protein
VLAAATLDAAQWQAVMNAADEETRRFIETLHPEIRRSPPEEMTESLVESPQEGPIPAPTAPSLHDVVERIERRRRSRSTIKGVNGHSSSGATPGLFRWECGPGGEIAWVDGAPRGALIGRSIARAQNGDGEGVGQDVVRAFAVRAPFRDGVLSVAGEGAVSGAWKISGVPAFGPADGRFRGYRGIAMRELADGAVEDDGAGGLSDPASVRELVHEVKTPLNAILGFAEIIEGQYLGPADRPYRERAEDIVRQARILLTAIDDVDFVAKVHSAAGDGARRANLSAAFDQVMPRLAGIAEARKVSIEAPRVTRAATVASEQELAERLISRFASALIEQADPGERLRFSIDRTRGRLRISMTVPAILSTLSRDQLLGDGIYWEQGFSLRLVRRLAQMIGAELAASQGTVSILFPAT